MAYLVFVFHHMFLGKFLKSKAPVTWLRLQVGAESPIDMSSA